MRLAMSASLVLAVGLAGQDSLPTLARLQRENDSLRARIVVLNHAVRDLILASYQYLTQARNAEALLSWYRNRPDRCAILPDST